MKPRVFVSSTFYDLKYIRDDIGNFIKMHDFEPILFEDGDIGYTPNETLESSCYKTAENADMFILIIGGEYGTPATDEKKENSNSYNSITRKEFHSAAKAKIPTYVFIESSVYHEYNIYDVNYENIENQKTIIEFKSTKNINVFRFIREIKSLTNNPIQEFKNSSDIKSFLSKQWADMFKKHLESLKKEKDDAIIQSTVVDIKSLIEQMSFMVEAMGKKVVVDKQQYDNVIKKQNKIEAKRIVQAFINGLSAEIFFFYSKEENVNKLLDLLIDAYFQHQATKYIPESLFDMNDELHKRIVESINSEFSNGKVTPQFINSLPGIVVSLKNSEIRELVFKSLLAKDNYNKIFKNTFDFSDDYDIPDVPIE